MAAAKATASQLGEEIRQTASQSELLVDVFSSTERVPCKVLETGILHCGGGGQSKAEKLETRSMNDSRSSHPVYSDEEDVEDLCARFVDDDSDDDDLGSLDEAWVCGTVPRDITDPSTVDEGADKVLFIPEPLFSLSSAVKVVLPRLTVEQLPPGTQVWVTDEDDVEVLLREFWHPFYRAVCNGRQRGTVMRHSESVTLVRFVDPVLDIVFSCSLPRVALSTEAITIYDTPPRTSNHLYRTSFCLSKAALGAAQAEAKLPESALRLPMSAGGSSTSFFGAHSDDRPLLSHGNAGCVIPPSPSPLDAHSQPHASPPRSISEDQNASLGQCVIIRPSASDTGGVRRASPKATSKFSDAALGAALSELRASSRCSDCAHDTGQPGVVQFTSVVDLAGPLYYEAPGVFLTRAPDIPHLTEAQQAILEGRFNKAFGIAVEVHRSYPPGGPEYAKVLAVLSSACFFMREYQEALKYGKMVTQLNRQWVRGYLCVSRANSGMGAFTNAARALSSALILCPQSEAILRIRELNDYLAKLQGELRYEKVLLALDGQYRLRLMARKAFNPNDSVFSETDAIVAMPSSSADTRGCCCVCLRSAVTELPVEVEGQAATSGQFCSVDCFHRASLFLPMEQDRHAEGYSRACALLKRAEEDGVSASVIDTSRLAIRLFFMVCVTHSRLNNAYAAAGGIAPGELTEMAGLTQQRLVSGMGDCPDSLAWGSAAHNYVPADMPLYPIEGVLKRLGVFPIPTSLGLSATTGSGGTISVHSGTPNEQAIDVHVLYRALTMAYSERDRERYSEALFAAVFQYTHAYAVEATVTKVGNVPFVGYFLSRLVGAVGRVEPHGCGANCVLEVCGSTFSLVAKRLIAKGEMLTTEQLM